MSIFRVGSLSLLVVAGVCGTAWADVPLAVANPIFSSPAITCNNYSYSGIDDCGAAPPTQNLSGNGWTFGAGQDGITNLGSLFNTPAGLSAPFSQAAFLQGDGASVSQTFGGGAGTYSVSFYLGSRNGSGGNDGAQTVNVTLDNIVHTYTLTNNTPFTKETITAGLTDTNSHTLTFSGAASGDHTAFVSDVNVSNGGTPVTLADPKFSTPTVGCNNYAYSGTTGCLGTPPTQDLASSGWTFGANSGDGLTSLTSAFNTPAFLFSQAAFLQGAGSSVSQSITGPASQWNVSFYLGSRYADGSGGYDGKQTVEVLLGGNIIGTYSLSSFTPFTLETISVPGVAAGSHDLEFLGMTTGDHTAFVTGVSITAPEPMSLAMLGANLAGLGLLGLCLRLRRSRRA